MLLALLLLITLQPASDSLAADSAVARALVRSVALYAEPLDPEWTESTMRVAWVDLNADERLDALVYLRGTSWCGSGGCTVLVMEAVDPEDIEELGDFMPAAEISLMHGSVIIAPSRTSGWHDLVVTDDEGAWRRLRFDGETYPFSPSEGELLESEPGGGTVLFAEDVP